MGSEPNNDWWFYKLWFCEFQCPQQHLIETQDQLQNVITLPFSSLVKDHHHTCPFYAQTPQKKHPHYHLFNKKERPISYFPTLSILMGIMACEKMWSNIVRGRVATVDCGFYWQKAFCSRQKSNVSVKNQRLRPSALPKNI